MSRDIDAPGASPPPRSRHTLGCSARPLSSRCVPRGAHPRGAPATSSSGRLHEPCWGRKVTWFFSEKPGRIRQLGGVEGRRRGAGGTPWKSPGQPDHTFSLSSGLLLLGAEIVGRLCNRCGGGRGGIGALLRRRRGDSARRSFAAAAPGLRPRARRSVRLARRPRVRLRASPRRVKQRVRTLVPLCRAGSLQPAWRRTA